MGAAIREAVKQGAGGLHFRAFDLNEVDAIPSFVMGLRDEFGALYGLVNNAGIGTEGLLAMADAMESECRRQRVSALRKRSRQR